MSGKWPCLCIIHDPPLQLKLYMHLIFMQACGSAAGSYGAQLFPCTNNDSWCHTGTTLFDYRQNHRVVLADGKTTQTGMSTSLIVALALLGMARDSVYEKFTNIIILERASVSTLPFAIDKSGPETSKGQ